MPERDITGVQKKCTSFFCAWWFPGLYPAGIRYMKPADFIISKFFSQKPAKLANIASTGSQIQAAKKAAEAA